MRLNDSTTAGDRGARHVVECRGVVKTYRSGARETRAVRGLDLDVAAGEWVAVIGPSGCGKSTLLHLLGGLDAADEGECRGRRASDLARLSEARRAAAPARHGSASSSSSSTWSPNLTVAENVELPAAARRRRSPGRAPASAASLLDGVGLGRPRRRRCPRQLSGGEQQRVAIARALANQPSVLLADEPTGNLDTAAAREVLRLLGAVQHAAGQTIVMVTHDARVAAAADRRLVMQDGRFAAVEATSLPVESLLAEPAAREP